MATAIATSNLTMLDIARETLPDGSIDRDIVEMQSQEMPILQDIPWMEGNGGTYHRSTIRIGIPEVSFRQFYQGVAPVKTEKQQVDEPIGMMEARSTVDAKELDMSPDPAQTRTNEMQGIMEGFNQTFVQTLLYSSVSTSPAKFNGIMGRFSDTTAPNGENIILGGGSGSDNTSILLVNWGTRYVCGIYPRGSRPGIIREDLGRQEVLDSQTPARRYTVYEDKLQWDCGLLVKDWRHVVRAPNIDKSALVAQSGAAALLEIMAAMVDKLPASEGGRPVFYVNRTLSTMLRIQCMKQANVYLTVGTEEGRRKIQFDGVPIRKLDAMQADEALVS
jgi:Major capsid protein GP7